MATDYLGNVEIALVVSIGALRSILRNLKVGGRRWWIASDPKDAVEDEAITVGFGEERGSDP